MLRRILVSLCLAALLSACASTSSYSSKPQSGYPYKEGYGTSFVYICRPGSAIKHRVPAGLSWPPERLWKGGSCAFNF